MEEVSIEIGQISDENILNDTNLSSWSFCLANKKEQPAYPYYLWKFKCKQAKELREVDLGGREEPIGPSIGICCLWCRFLILWRRFLILRRRILTDGLRMLYSTLWFISPLWSSTSFTFDHSYHVQKKVQSAKKEEPSNLNHRIGSSVQKSQLSWQVHA